MLSVLGGYNKCKFTISTITYELMNSVCVCIIAIQYMDYSTQDRNVDTEISPVLSAVVNYIGHEAW